MTTDQFGNRKIPLHLSKKNLINRLTYHNSINQYYMTDDRQFMTNSSSTYKPMIANQRPVAQLPQQQHQLSAYKTSHLIFSQPQVTPSGFSANTISLN